MNLLGAETSPYLLQHRDNPVHWRPWSTTALREARDQDKPILLSIGYAACHWCHVMAHESFENASIAALMNAHFINIKVDREERPDLDKIYMDALHALGEQGGWPLTMFLDGSGNPFWGGTYFPPEPRYGRPGFPNILREIARLWKAERHRITTNIGALREALGRSRPRGTSGMITSEDSRAAALAILPYVDLAHGGLKGAPKFPQAPVFRYLWMAGHILHHDGLRGAVDITLRHICQGGIYDHIGGGFARYSVDGRWLVPHFEKMLYDNAQLVSLLTRVWLRTGRPLFRTRIEETLEFVLTEMRLPSGAFASSYDADSEGVEGKYYVWSYAELEQHLGPASAAFAQAYDISADGNWEGHSIPNRLHAIDGDPRPFPDTTAGLAAIRRARIPPGYDDKLLADWNGLMVQALAEAAIVFRRPDWAEAGRTALDATLQLLWKDGTLFQSHRTGRTQHLATADGYANLIAAALALVPFNSGNITTAASLLAALDRDFWAGSAYAFASSATPDLVVRQIFADDNATPNANGVMAQNLIRLAALSGNNSHRDKAAMILSTFATAARGSPFNHPTLFAARLLFDTTVELKCDASHPHVPDALQAIGLDIVLAPRAGHEGTLLVCRNSACSLPVTTVPELAEALTLLNLP